MACQAHEQEKRDRNVISMRDARGYTFTRIAVELGVTPARAREIYYAAERRELARQRWASLVQQYSIRK